MFLDGFTLVFDLDGTLVETAPDLHRATNQIMNQEGLDKVTLENVRAFVGQGARALIQRGAAKSNVKFDDEKLDKLTLQFIDIYQTDIAAKSHLFEDVESTLDMLSSEGAKFCVCTNKNTALAIKLLEALSVAHRFESIVGADAVAHKKPHKDHYLHALNAAGGALNKSIMIGDSVSDVGAARNAGVPVILVSFGYTDIAPEELTPDAIINHYSELPNSLKSLLEKGT
ncbi:phosphoglycolate phosphatase [Hirschia litorea]|uniref:phosphoglycolate phosphatase n=1 Tax=Hirschia litorea TaxID=1199156 RepID=A0ABW2IIH4_9PROT